MYTLKKLKALQYCIIVHKLAYINPRRVLQVNLRFQNIMISHTLF